MNKISIKIVVAGRTYPLTVNENEKEAVRKAVDDINTNIQRLQESYAVKDMQDLLAMTALQLATRTKSVAQAKEVSEANDHRLEEFENKVFQALSALSEGIVE